MENSEKSRKTQMILASQFKYLGKFGKILKRSENSWNNLGNSRRTYKFFGKTTKNLNKTSFHRVFRVVLKTFKFSSKFSDFFKNLQNFPRYLKIFCKCYLCFIRIFRVFKKISKFYQVILNFLKNFSSFLKTFRNIRKTFENSWGLS